MAPPWPPATRPPMTSAAVASALPATLPAAVPVALPAAITPGPAGTWVLSGHWTVRGLGRLPQALDSTPGSAGAVLLDGAALQGMDSGGAWVLQRWLQRQHGVPTLRDWQPRWQELMGRVAQHGDATPALPAQRGFVARTGVAATAAAQQAQGLLAFIGETAVALVGVLAHPQRLRWRTVLRHIKIAGFDALPIIGLTSFLLGVVVAYQGADQLRHYGANIYVVDLVGHAMLREFAPLITAIIVAGRSGSAYAAQIGTMVVTEEVDSMRTMAIPPLELLVLPKLLALAVALPLLTLFADITGVMGGMVMARSQLGIGFYEFAERFGREMRGDTLLLGIGKSLVFAAIIGVIGCFQGFRTRGSAESVGRQTTLSVVQAIFLVIVVNALFSVVFNMLDL